LRAARAAQGSRLSANDWESMGVPSRQEGILGNGWQSAAWPGPNLKLIHLA